MVDTVSDMLVAIKNAQAVKKPEVFIPFSKFKFEIAKILEKEGFIERVEKTKRKVKKGRSKPKPFLKIILKYEDGLGKISEIKRVSKPGQRVYKGWRELKPVKSGLGIAILSTPRGIITNKKAKKLKVGGEVICELW